MLNIIKSLNAFIEAAGANKNVRKYVTVVYDIYRKLNDFIFNNFFGKINFLNLFLQTYLLGVAIYFIVHHMILLISIFYK